MTVQNPSPPAVFPTELLKPPAETSTLTALLSGVGIGAVVAAAISGLILWLVEGRKQKGENARKVMELRRQDQRQWDEEIRKSYAEAQATLRTLRVNLTWTRLIRAASVEQPKGLQPGTLVEQFKEALSLRNSLASLTDKLSPIADDDLVKAYQTAVDVWTAYLEKFKGGGDQMTYPLERFQDPDDPDFDKIEADLLSATKAALKTPDLP
ncbi:hypothetical protein [Mycolicibacterium sp. PDY-3]|uniref:hypothetical protein n=1 Tax=Mycolicibacterium sp. PDY-3 TaxID=3376069 RepID=UPI0037AD8D81